MFRYVEQWAWLNTRAKDQKQSRQAHLQSEEIAERFPDVEPFGYLISLLSRIGVAMSSGSGVYGITWQELNSFMISTKTDLTSWEAETIKRLSAVYANGVVKYDNIDCAAPYRSEKEKERISQDIKSALRSVVIKDRHGSGKHTN